MGKLTLVKSFERAESGTSDVKVDPGGGPLITAQHFSDPGDDSHPLPDDYATTVGTLSTGRENAVGYVDPNNQQKAQPGEKRIYARDENGDQVCEIWLKNDGSVRCENANGSFELEVGGDFVISDTVRITPAGKITGVSEIEVGGKELNNHDHPITSGSSAPGPTGPNNA